MLPFWHVVATSRFLQDCSFALAQKIVDDLWTSTLSLQSMARQFVVVFLAHMLFLAVTLLLPLLVVGRKQGWQLFLQKEVVVQGQL